MKTESIHAVEMVRKIRDEQAALYWKDKAAYIKEIREAAQKIKAILSEQRSHGS